jgi:hypothetical protein
MVELNGSSSGVTTIHPRFIVAILICTTIDPCGQLYRQRYYMSKLYHPGPELIGCLMESELSNQHYDAIRSGQLTPDLLTGKQVLYATRPDAPFIHQHIRGVQISQSGDDAIMIVLDGKGRPIPVVSKATVWRPYHSLKFNTLEDLKTPTTAEFEIEVDDPKETGETKETGLITPDAPTKKTIIRALHAIGAEEVFTDNTSVFFEIPVEPTEYGEFNPATNIWIVYKIPADEATTDDVQEAGNGWGELHQYIKSALQERRPTSDTE